MPVDVLGAVTVMTVGIDNRNPFTAVMFADKFNHDRFIINITEAPVAVDDLHRVMPRRADHGKGFVDLSFHDQPGRFNRTTGGDEMGFGTDLFRPWKTVVNSIDIGVGCDFGLKLGDIGEIEKALFPELILSVEKAFLAFGVSRAYGPVVGREEDYPKIF